MEISKKRKVYALTALFVLSSSYLYDKQISHSAAAQKLSMWFHSHDKINDDVDAKKKYIDPSIFLTLLRDSVIEWKR